MKTFFLGLLAIVCMFSVANGQSPKSDLTPQQIEAFINSQMDPISYAAFAGFILANQPEALDALITKQLGELSRTKSACHQEFSTYCASSKGVKIVDCLEGKTISVSCKKELEVVSTLVRSKRAVEIYKAPHPTTSAETGKPVAK